MGEDRYRLAPVRDARERAEASRRGELAGAIHDARATDVVLAAARGRTAAAREALSAAVAARAPLASTSASAIARADAYIARCRRDLAAARDEELRAEAAHAAKTDAIDLARATLARARADRELVERHFARWREARRKLADRRDD